MPRASTNGANCDVNGEVGCDVKRDVNGVADAIEKLRRRYVPMLYDIVWSLRIRALFTAHNNL
jgi:hypothetical protein